MEALRACMFTLMGTSFTFLLTTLGATTIFVVREKQTSNLKSICMGLAAGIMMASAIWSLLMPALELSNEAMQIPWLTVAFGFLLGGLSFYFVDLYLTYKYWRENVTNHQSAVNKLFTVITLHNIPEGMAIGLSFAIAVQEKSQSALAAAAALAIGIGVQNLPEGAAIALPVYQDSGSKKKAFLCGSLSGIVEPIGGIFAVLLVESMRYLLPVFLAFAAGAMLYVIVDELIPEVKQENGSNIGTVGTLCGFLLMMILDIALG